MEVARLEKHNVEEILNLIVLKQFIGDLEKRTQKWVQQHQPQTEMQAPKINGGLCRSRKEHTEKKRHKAVLAIGRGIAGGPGGVKEG